MEIYSYSCTAFILFTHFHLNELYAIAISTSISLFWIINRKEKEINSERNHLWLCTIIFSIDIIYDKTINRTKMRIDTILGKLPTRKERISTPNQSKIAIGSGGLWAKAI